MPSKVSSSDDTVMEDANTPVVQRPRPEGAHTSMKRASENIDDPARQSEYNSGSELTSENAPDPKRRRISGDSPKRTERLESPDADYLNKNGAGDSEGTPDRSTSVDDDSTDPHDMPSTPLKSADEDDSDIPDEKAKKKPYKCTVPGCIKSYKKLNGLIYHRQSMHAAVPDPDDPKPYKCHIEGCMKEYRNSNGLAYHLEHGHGDDGEKLEELLSMPVVNREPSEKPFACPYKDCGKTYKNANGLAYHLQKARSSHSVEEAANSPARTYICAVSNCGKAFKSPQSLATHLESAHGDNQTGVEPAPTSSAPTSNKNVYCPSCMRQFKSKPALEKHMLSVHKHSHLGEAELPSPSSPVSRREGSTEEEEGGGKEREEVGGGESPAGEESEPNGAGANGGADEREGGADLEDGGRPSPTRKGRGGRKGKGRAGEVSAT
ncbi:hypothetical protein HDV00_000448 [Rhizophlyctis rosea]|nr:hypothetical protein HDV00_000448 [Rhizophlyctis rosea]